MPSILTLSNKYKMDIINDVIPVKIIICL
jgi:hypothetical protein